MLIAEFIVILVQWKERVWTEMVDHFNNQFSFDFTLSHLVVIMFKAFGPIQSFN